jgi:hypothetical protein
MHAEFQYDPSRNKIIVGRSYEQDFTHSGEGKHETEQQVLLVMYEVSTAVPFCSDYVALIPVSCFRRTSCKEATCSSKTE